MRSSQGSRTIGALTTTGVIVVAMLSVQAGVAAFTGLSVGMQATEAMFALATRVLVQVALLVIPGMQMLWDTEWQWRNLILLVVSVLLVPLTLWALTCFPDPPVPIPGYNPGCTFASVVMEALYPGFLAFLINYVGEDAYQRVRKRDYS